MFYSLSLHSVTFCRKILCLTDFELASTAGLPKGQFSLAMTYRVSGNEEKHHGKYLAVVLGSLDQLRRRGGFPFFMAVEAGVGGGAYFYGQDDCDGLSGVIVPAPR